MTTTYTYSETFTRSNARYVASKVAADLRLLQRVYGRPTDADVDDRAGRVTPGINITGASWSSYLVYSYTWGLLDAAERARIKARLPVQRTGADEPSSSNGSWVQDRSYSAGGSGVRRASFRPW